MWTRRNALFLPLAAGACATLPGGPPLDAQFTNIETLSESVHSGVSSEDGEQRLTMRLCRYPQLGLAWLWMHARIDGQFYSFVNHIAPSGTDATVVDGDSVRYADAANSLVFERKGKVTAPTAATVSGTCMARKSATSAFGNGDQSMEATIAFSPEQVEIGGELGARGVGPLERALVALETVVGEALDALVGADEFRAAVELLPDPVLCEGDGGGDHDRNGDASSKRGGFFHLVSSALP